MKKFIVFFKNKNLSKILRDLSDDLMKNMPNQFDCHIKGIAFVEFDHSSELNEFVDLFLTIDRRNIEYLVTIDNKLNICYIYKANGQLSEIKKNIMPLLGEAYVAIQGDELILEKFEDLRMLYLFSNPSLN